MLVIFSVLWIVYFEKCVHDFDVLMIYTCYLPVIYLFLMFVVFYKRNKI